MITEHLTYEVEYQTLNESHSYIVSPRRKTLEAAKETMKNYLSDHNTMWVKAHVHDSASRLLYSIDVYGEKIEEKLTSTPEHTPNPYQKYENMGLTPSQILYCLCEDIDEKAERVKKCLEDNERGQNTESYLNLLIRGQL
jgi:hypothetical protein